MKNISGHKVGLVLGSTFGLWHLMWAILVALGLAQPILDFIFQLHFLNNPYTVSPFSLTNALLLVIVTFVVGYVIGWVFVWLWDYVHRMK